MKITSYPTQTSTGLGPDDVFITDGSKGTKKISKADLTYALFEDIPQMHNQVWRGKNLGASFTAAQHAQIKAGTFHDIWVGDYWTDASNNRWRVMDIDYFEVNDTSPGHHLILVPDNCPTSGKHRDSGNSTKGGYRSSDLRKTYPPIASAISNTMGVHPLTKTYYMVNDVDSDSGAPKGGEITRASMESMNDVMVFGTHIKSLSVTSDRHQGGYRETTLTSQLAGFRLNRQYIASNATYWLSDTCGSVSWACVTTHGANDAVGASSSLGVRPFVIAGG